MASAVQKKLLRKDFLSPRDPPKNRSSTSSDNDDKNPKPHLNDQPCLALAPTPSSEDLFLSGASHLTRAELLRRRTRHLRQLSRCYRRHYWALMEELRIQYRNYYWEYGVSPIREGRDREAEAGAEGTGETTNVSLNTNLNANCGRVGFGLGSGIADGNHRCVFVGCKLKAMALTSFCHLHILSDSKQKLYKACSYVIKSAQAGPITCGKPILRSTVPSLCTVHFQKAQKHVMRALKKAGLNVSSSNKVAPKFHVIAAEYVRQIQSKRRAVQRANNCNAVVKKEGTS